MFLINFDVCNVKNVLQLINVMTTTIMNYLILGATRNMCEISFALYSLHNFHSIIKQKYERLKEKSSFSAVSLSI